MKKEDSVGGEDATEVALKGEVNVADKELLVIPPFYFFLKTEKSLKITVFKRQQIRSPPPALPPPT